MKERPTSVTVFAVINLLLAGLGVLGLIWALIVRLGVFVPPGAEQDPTFKLLQENAGYRLLTDLMTGLGAVVTILIIAASIGMFMLKPWSRLVTIGWGVWNIVTGVLMGVVNHMLIVRPTLAQLAGKPEHTAVLVFTMIAYGVALLFMGYYVLMIFMLTRPKVVEAFTPDEWGGDRDRWEPLPGGANP